MALCGEVEIANNTILGGNSALVERANITADGDMSVAAKTDASILANVKSEVQASTSVGVVLAFNTIGYAPADLFHATIDALAGNSDAGESYVASKAIIKDSALTVDGGLSVNSDWSGSVIAVIESAALALKVNTGSSQGNDDATSVTVAPIIALNKISSRTEALILNLSDDADNTVGGDLTVHAIGTTQILATLESSAISVAAGASGSQKAIGIGAVIGRNVVNADSTAEVEGANAVLDVDGAVLVQALDDSLIHAELYATAVSIGAGTQDVKAIAMAAAWLFLWFGVFLPRGTVQ